MLESPAAAESETQAMARWMTGESFFHQEDYAAALQEYLQVDARYGRWHAAALLQAGKCQEQLAEWQAAADLYEQLLQQHPDSELNVEAQSRLATLRARANKPAAARK